MCQYCSHDDYMNNKAEEDSKQPYTKRKNRKLVFNSSKTRRIPSGKADVRRFLGLVPKTKAKS